MKISDKVQQIRNDYERRSVEIVKNKYKFNQYNTIQRIYLYLNNQFYNNVPEDTIFWNISIQRIPHFAKNIDLDTKNLKPLARGVNAIKSLLLRAKFEKWARDNGLAIKLDDIAESLATFGSTVVKKDRSQSGLAIEECDLRNLYFNPQVSCIRDTDIVEVHYLNETTLRAKKDVWDNVEDLIKQGIKDDNYNNKKDKVQDFEIWEFWGEVEEDGKMKYKQIIGSGEGDKEVILYESEENRKKCPYYDFHIHKFKGRWLRIGVVERLFKLQEQANSVVNQNAEARSIASLLLLQSQNPEIEGNVLKNAESGDIIQDGTLQQIPIDNRAFNVLLNELTQIEAKADKLCMTPDVVTGEELPSGTTFRGQAQLSNAAKSAFKSAQDRLGATLEEFLRQEVMPYLRKEFKKGDIVDIAKSEEDIEQYDKIIVNNRVQQLVNKIKVGEVKLESPEELQERIAKIEEQVEEELEQEGREIEIDKDFLNIDWDIKFNITGESQDRAQANEAYYNALNMYNANPDIINTPLMKQYLENNGISWWRVKPSKKKKTTRQQQQPQQQKQQLPKRNKPDKLMSMVNSNN